jgi:hypothetical protein
MLRGEGAKAMSTENLKCIVTQYYSLRGVSHEITILL